MPGGPRSFRFGLGLSIHLNNRVDTKEDPPPPLPPVKISVAGVGAKFIRSGLIGPVFDSGVLDADSERLYTIFFISHFKPPWKLTQIFCFNEV